MIEVRRIARFSAAAAVVATLGLTSVSGALAQDEGIYGGGGGDTGAAPVTTDVAPAPTTTEVAPAPSDVGAAPVEDVQVPEVTPATLGVEAPAPATEEVAAPAPAPAPAPVAEEVAAPAPVTEELPVPELATEIVEDLTVPEPVDVAIDEELPAALDLTAIFGENFPFPDEGEAEGAVDAGIDVGGTGGGTITLGGGAEGGISIGGGDGGTTSGT